MDLEKLKKRIKKNEKFSAKTFVTAHFSMIFSLGFAIFELFLAIFSKSTWYYSLFFYHLAFFGMRLGNLIVIRKKKLIKKVMNEKADLGLYMSNGIFLIVLNAIFALAVIQMAFYGKNFGKPGILVYVYAVYAIYKFIVCGSNVERAFRTENCSTRAIRVINFGDALVSIVALQSALLLSFNHDPSKNGWYNFATGSAVCAIMIASGILMIIHSAKGLKRLKKAEFVEETNN